MAGVAACASAPINKPAAADLARADALVAEGCYDCLSEARDIYAKVAVARARPLVLPRLFETTVLLGLREKELAGDSAARFEAAAALAAELPPAYPAAEYLQIATAIPPDPGGTPRVELVRRRIASPQYTAWQQSLATGAASDLFRQYLSLSLECMSGPPRAPAGGTGASEPTARPSPPIVLVYRLAACQPLDRVVLAGLIDAYPRFLEAGVFLGRFRSGRPTGKEVADARKWLTAGAARWPDSTVVNYALGSLNQTVGDCQAAVAFYDKTLALRPLHEDAHLGRLTCLSYLRRYDVAIDEATTMIAAHTSEGEAQFWRAWNKRELGQLAAARADSDRTKQILFNSRVMTLAGQIEYDSGDLDTAEKDLNEALGIDRGDCTAQWYLSLVRLKREAWTDTADGFVLAMQCYQRSVDGNRSYLEDTKNAQDVDETFRASQIAALEAAIKSDLSQVGASAFNAAVGYARANSREKALQYCDLAARDPVFAAQAEELRKAIVK